MKIILLQDVPDVGQKSDVKSVADGYAMNFLIPNKLAELANAGRIKRIEVEKARLQEEKKIQEDLLLKNLEALKDVTSELHEKANEQGHLFKGLHKEEIARALREQAHIDILPEFITLEHPIKAVGEFEIKVRVQDKLAKFKLTVLELKA